MKLPQRMKDQLMEMEGKMQRDNGVDVAAGPDALHEDSDNGDRDDSTLAHMKAASRDGWVPLNSVGCDQLHFLHDSWQATVMLRKYNFGPEP